MQAGDSIVGKDGRTFVDVARVLPDGLEGGRRVEKIETDETRIEVCVRKHPGQGGHDSKSFVMNRYLELDGFFFENLGLWQGEGGKHKGLYLGNNCLELLQHFLKFSEERLGFGKEMFNVTLNVPEEMPEADVKRRWSKSLGIPYENFTGICVDTRINHEYAQLYINGIVLSELMNRLHESLKPSILESQDAAVSYLRGFFAGEAAVVLKEWGTVAHVAVANKNMEVIDFLTSCLSKLGIKRGKYFASSCKFPIYGKVNLDIVRKHRLLGLNDRKNKKFEDGMDKFQRTVIAGDKMERMILDVLKSGPKTYDEISAALSKGRSTIQSHYIPILEKKGMIRRAGKRKQAWLFELA